MIRMSNGRCFSRIQWSTAWLLALVCSAAFAGWALAESAPANPTPQQTVARLAVTVSARLDKETESLIKNLQASGEAAIPAITAGLAQKAEPLSVALMRALGGIGGDASTSLLVQLLADGPASETARLAVALLENRPVRRPLSAAELGTLTNLIRTSNIVVAGGAARVLGKCLMVPAPDQLAPTLERFESEIGSPSDVASLMSGYLSPRVYTLNQFLLAVSYIGKEAVPMLEQRRQRAAENSEVRKWLTLALGMAGDESVADDLADMALGDPDRYVRCVAVRGYARSAKQKAIPLLEVLASDKTESEYSGSSMDTRPVLLIGMAAMTELFRLKHEQASSSK